MSEKYPGGFVTYNPPTPSQTSATGIWTLSQQQQYQQAGLWPNSPSQISRSLRFNSADSTVLSRTPTVAGNRRTWTFSAWVKRAKLNSGNAILATVSGSALNYFSFGTSSGDWLQYAYFDGATDVFNVNTSGTSVFRDVSAWYHIVLFVDTTQATAANRVKIYVNNVQQTLGGTYPTQNYDTPINNSIPNYIGGATGSYTAYLSNQYMANIQFVDGQALDPTSFGEYNANTGVWQPLQKSLTYGTNGFQLTFNDNTNTTATTLGADSSGNGNNWTPSNFSVTTGPNNDSMVDSPTSYGTDTGVGGNVRGNYAVWNPLSTTRTLSNGNLYTEVTGGGGSNVPISSTMALPTTGKWYWEITAGGAAGGGNGGWDWGIVASSTPNFRLANLLVVGTTGCYGVNGNSGILVANAVSVATYISGGITGGAVAQVAYDADAGKLWLGKNNIWGTNGGVGDPSAGTNAGITGLSGEFIPVFEYASDSGLVSATLNMGQRAFAYTAPSGFKALCTQNLPTPTIGATTATQAGKYFNTVTYTGTGSSLGVTGVGFQPDWVWVKGRSGATDHALYDAVRGVQKQLESNTTDAETTETTGLTAFGSDGFTVGALAQMNTSAATYVSWNWKANGSGSTNTAGSLSATVSASSTSGFSVATFTSQSSGTATVGHGLGVAPSMYIAKIRTTDSWYVYHTSLGAGNFVQLNGTGASGAGANLWNSTAPTSTVFSMGSSWAGSLSMLVYCFAPIAGYSAFGSYTGANNTGASTPNANGPFIYTGFRPRFVLIKRTSAVANWVIYDSVRGTYNANLPWLYPNASSAETATEAVDFLSNGFKIRSESGATMNPDGGTFIYAAFAEAPFKYALAR